MGLSRTVVYARTLSESVARWTLVKSGLSTGKSDETIDADEGRITAVRPLRRSYVLRTLLDYLQGTAVSWVKGHARSW